MLFGTRDGLTQKSATGDDVFETGVSQLSGLVLSASERPRSHTFTQYTDDDSDFEDDDETISEEADLRLSVRTPSIPTGPRMSLLSRIDATDSIAVKSEGETSMSGSSTLALSSSQTQLIDLPAYGGSTILITGVAADTWEAVLYWLYTGTIQFAPLTSEGRSQRETAVKVARQANPDRPPPVSCKSVYRIADALKLESLKKQALAHLEHRLSMQTYLDEVFSDFTSKYEEVRKLEMLAVIKHWDQIKNSSALRTKMVDIATGKLPHAGSVMADLLMKASVKDTDADPTVGERESNQRSGSSGGVGRKRSLEV
ncbi:hypothetical protein BDY19DRAFT_21772 [Irpex rosettiformis]|uniref:Uncharacterized protein n=1 Tax=Irpex rosettiformis TaxID=378272 RepID=A0ACB8UJ62_9APHY|nr:hypothetical protein BDY19DRAFT_21772 [Irpex rosettiformis]